MSAPTPPLHAEDAAIEQPLGKLLRVGVIAAAAVTLAGGVAMLARHGGDVADFRVFAGDPESLRSVSGVVSQLGTLSPTVIVQFGLLLLIATPIMRVVFSLLAFAIRRDRTYVVVTLIVLSLLAWSLFSGHG